MISHVFQVFEQSTDAVFGIDDGGTIRFWNNSCEKLTGYNREKVVGTACAGVLCGVDLHGKAVCGPNCPLPKVYSGKPTTGNIDMMINRVNGDSVMVNVGAYYTPAELQECADKVCVFFSLRRINARQLLHRMANTWRPDTRPRTATSKLTIREKQLLGMASEGMKTREIADQLNISPETVRNHFKNIFPKLGAHSRAEAVGIGLRYDLI